MVKKKTQDHKTTRGLSEKKNEEAIVNMVMAIITKSKALEEVAFQENKLIKGKEPEYWQEENKFKQLMVKIIQELQKKKNYNNFDKR